jgi:hypothetical protein
MVGSDPEIGAKIGIVVSIAAIGMIGFSSILSSG